jgi:hypothetical protein
MSPARVKDHYEYWANPPPILSAKCTYWLVRIRNGWKRNNRILKMGYDESAEFFGVYIWEYINILTPELRRNEDGC